jgi:hypothetical protein
VCFYLYAPSSELTIEYASESITLLQGGRSEVVIDLLLLNLSEKPIEEIHIVYPNVFFKVIPSKKAQKKTEFLLTEEGTFKDITRTILDRDSEYNWAYKYSAYKFRESSTEQDFKKVEIIQPNPKNPRQELSKEGIVAGSIRLQPMNDLTPFQWIILQHLKYTLLKGVFDPPISAKSYRWCRWHFCGKSAAINPKRQKERWLRMTNQLTYDYQIFGPYDVKNRLMEYLYILQDKLHEYSGSIDLFNEIKDLIERLEKEGLRYHSEVNQNYDDTLKIKDWRIHITPGILRRLTDILMQGNIEIVGGRLPNFFTDEKKIIPVYQWRTGIASDSLQTEKAFSFSIIFQGKESSELIYYLSIFSFILVILLTIFILLRN